MCNAQLHGWPRNQASTASVVSSARDTVVRSTFVQHWRWRIPTLGSMV